MTVSTTAPGPPVAARPATLTAEERRILAKRRFSPADRAAVAHLLAPFEAALRTWTLQDWVYGVKTPSAPFREQGDRTNRV